MRLRDQKLLSKAYKTSKMRNLFDTCQKTPKGIRKPSEDVRNYQKVSENVKEIPFLEKILIL
jgi:hypothetical protein